MPIPHSSEVAAWQLSFPTLGPSETMEGTVRDTGGVRGTTGRADCAVLTAGGSGDYSHIRQCRPSPTEREAVAGERGGT